MIRVIGLDPGLRVTGWGVVASDGVRLIHVANGLARSTNDATTAERLREIHDALAEAIAAHAPDEAAVEETFANTNAASTLKLGLARGVVMLAPALAGLPVAEYAANTVKKSVVGAGHADKTQIQAMVARLLPGVSLAGADAADALAVAICHAHHALGRRRVDAHAPHDAPVAR